jgi:hypothetical protein
VLAFGEKTCKPRFRLRGGVGARHADDIEAVLARRAGERLLDGGRISSRC